MNIFFKILSDAIALFNTNKAPMPVGEVSFQEADKGEVVEAFEIAAKECFANYGSKFEIAAVREENDKKIKYKLYILFDYPDMVKKSGEGWVVNEKAHSELLEANKIVAGVIERRKGVPIMYGG